MSKETLEEYKWIEYERGYDEGYEAGVNDFAEVEKRKALLRAMGFRVIGDPIKLTRKQKIVKIVVEAGMGFILWTTILTPYILEITLVTTPQYLSWLLMEAIIVPPVSVVVVKAINWLTKKLGL